MYVGYQQGRVSYHSVSTVKHQRSHMNPPVRGLPLTIRVEIIRCVNSQDPNTADEKWYSKEK